MQKDKDIQWDCSNRGVWIWLRSVLQKVTQRKRLEFWNLKSSFRNLDDLAVDVFIFDRQLSDTNRQLKSSRSGAAGIEVQHSIASFLLGNVTVPRDHDPESGGLGLQI